MEDGRPPRRPRGLPPFPNGWFLLAFTSDLPPGGVLARSFMGQEVVAFRTASGRPAVVDAHCPHLGAHFGFGGTVEGELLRCPFHAFCYDVQGNCVRTGYGTRPPGRAKLRRWPLREQNGMLLVHHHVRGLVPAWEVPAVDMRGWARLRRRRFVLFDHPQETTENSVDLGHFGFVHGYRGVRMLHELVVGGPHLGTAFAVQRPFPGLRRWFPDRVFEFEFETEIFGLGYSLVNVTVPGIGARARLWVLPTPIDEDRITLDLALSLWPVDPGRVHRLLALVPAGAFNAALARAMLEGFAHDARQDFPIWENKRYLDRPALAAGDGPIGAYRRWARQFYEGASEPVTETVPVLGRPARSLGPRPEGRS